jgi:inorganic triphosphatase YgiF
MATGEHDLIEIERKFDVDDGFMLPDLAGPGRVTVAPAEVWQLSATYFDTGDLRLAAAHITLRRRTGGTDAGWHIKLPVDADTRRERHFPLGPAAAGGPASVPAPVAAEVADWTQGAPLRPVARLETTRTVRRLGSPDGQVLAEVADDQVTGSRPDPADPARWRPSDAWRELEVELVGGDRGLLARVAGQLVAAGARPSRSPSKLARVLGTGPR